MVISIRRSIHALILLALLLTPLFTIAEIMSLVSGVYYVQSIAQTPVYIKGLKDLIFLLITLIGTAVMLASGRTNRLIVPYVVFLLYVAGAAVLALAVDPRLAAAGLRWSLPIFLTFLLIRYVDEPLLERVARVLAWLFLLHFAAQVLELFVMAPWYGINRFGLAARVPGIFFIPNTAGFFSVLCLYFAVFHLEPGKLRTAVFAMSPVSVLLTQSGTGIIVLVLFAALLVIGPRKSLWVLPLAPVALLLLLLVLPFITGRHDNYVEVSGGTRVEIFWEMLQRGEVIPLFFGFATNTAVDLVHALSEAKVLGQHALIADSTYSSIVGNLGLIGLLALIAFGIGWLVVLLNHKRLDLYAFTLIFTLYGASTIIMEAFPANLLFAVLLAHYFRLFYLRVPEGAEGQIPPVPSVAQG